MERITVKTKHETVSIHVITIITLFFLPATFVAVSMGLYFFFYDHLLVWILTGCQTFFGSGVIDFEREGEKSQDTDKWGYWQVRWGALRLFGAFIGPLTGMVLATWAVTYFRSWRKRRAMERRHMNGTGV